MYNRDSKFLDQSWGRTKYGLSPVAHVVHFRAVLRKAVVHYLQIFVIIYRDCSVDSYVIVCQDAAQRLYCREGYVSVPLLLSDAFHKCHLSLTIVQLVFFLCKFCVRCSKCSDDKSNSAILWHSFVCFFKFLFLWEIDLLDKLSHDLSKSAPGALTDQLCIHIQIKEICL